MKKVLLILFVLAICVLAFPHGVMALDIPATGGAVEIGATYGDEAATTFTAVLDGSEADPWSWPLSVGVNTKNTAIHFSVDSLADWSITATDTLTGTGYMQGSEHPLSTLFEISTEYVPVWNDLAGADLPINEGHSSTSPQPFDESIRQTVTGTDYASTTGYQMEITFTLSAPF
jgi:hypothetical protein